MTISESIGIDAGVGPSAVLSNTTPAIDLPQITNLERLAEVADLKAVGTAEYRAYHPATQRQVIARVFTGSPTSDSHRFFSQHRKVASRLAGHAAIVPVLDASTTSEGLPYIITPFYARGSLARFMADHGPVGWPHTAFLLELIAVTVAELHGSRIAHRSLRPSSIVLTDYLMPRLDRFENSLRFETIPAAENQPKPSGYIAPEVLDGAPADPASDVFGLGATMWGLLAGHPPPHATARGASDASIMSQTLKGVPSPIQALIQRTMEPDPRLRPANGADFVTALRRSVSLAEAETRNTAPRSVMASLASAETVELVEDSATPERSAHGDSTSAEGAFTTTVPPQAATTADASHVDSYSPPRPIRSANADARWLLAIVGLITIAIVSMVAAAILAVQ